MRNAFATGLFAFGLPTIAEAADDAGCRSATRTEAYLQCQEVANAMPEPFEVNFTGPRPETILIQAKDTPDHLWPMSRIGELPDLMQKACNSIIGVGSGMILVRIMIQGDFPPPRWGDTEQVFYTRVCDPYELPEGESQ